MLSKNDIQKLLIEINLSTSYNLYLDDIKYKDRTLVYEYIYSEENCYIYSKRQITKDEKIILEILLSERIRYDLNYTHSDKSINNIFEKDLNDIEIEEILNRLNIDKNDNMIITTLKIYKKDRLDEAFEILINIEEIDLITIFNNQLVILLTNKTEDKALELSKLIVELIEIEILENIKIGISSLDLAISIKELYNESISSIKLSEKFNLENNIHREKDLFIYKIISLMNRDNINYSSRYIDKYKIKKLNKEEIKTAKIFLDFSLNISEAARKLYIHRNTLIYRLDKIKKITGIDLRIFDDSLKFKILLIFYNNINYNKRK